MITEIRGQFVLGEKGTSAKTRRMASNASFGLRSRRVSPKSQSSISYPPRCHSSVQEKTNAPAQPPTKALRTCHSSESACAFSPFRRLSKPISANRSEERRVGKDG